MKSSITTAALAGAGALCFFFAPVQTRAATVNIDFTFTNTSTGTIVNGEIDGLTVGATSSASAVSITSYTNGSPPPYIFPTPMLMTSVTLNSFTTDALGGLTDAHFNGDGFFGTNSSFVNVVLDRVNGASTDTAGVIQTIIPDSGSVIQTGGDFGKLDYVAVSPTSATPLPAALPLFATGLGALGLFGWRRKRKQVA